MLPSRLRPFHLLLAASLAALWVALGAPAARAQGGVNLSWLECGSAGEDVRTFACNDNNAQHALIGSFIAPRSLMHLTGCEVVLDVEVEGSTLPPWWQMNRPGSCRIAGLQANFDFSSLAACSDYWSTAGGAMGGVSAYDMGEGGANRAQIRMVCAVAQHASGPWPGGVETYAFQLLLKSSNSTGPGACSGCNVGACIVLSQIKLTQRIGEGNTTITSPGLRNYVNWNGGVASCPGAASNRKTSWGKIKTIYRR